MSESLRQSSAEATGVARRTVIWRHFTWQVPAAWEMLLFSRDPHQGRCVFADRYMHRLEVNWTHFRRAPDFGRVLTDYRGALTQLPGVTEVKSAKVADWCGLKAVTAASENTRYGRFFSGENCLLELVFIWPGRQDATLEKHVLDSVRAQPPEASGRQRWRAFGMDFDVTPGLELTSCSALPGQVTLTFADPRQRRIEVFRRQGLVTQWLKTPVADWLTSQVPPRFRAAERRNEARQGHTIEHLSGVSPAAGLARVWGRTQPWQATAWLCPADGRLYSWTAAGADRVGIPRLTCCEPIHDS